MNETGPVSQLASGAVVPLILADDRALRQHLDALNETGTTPIAAGIDATPQPFLITLIGPYAESEDVFFDSPWQTDCDYGERVDGVWIPKQPRCDECLAVSHEMKDLRFPVTVLARPVTTPHTGFREHNDPNCGACITEYCDD